MEDTKNPSAAAPPDLKKKGPKSSDAKHGGRRNGAGRKKGVPNKLTADVKEAIMAAFSEIGGHEYLRKIARTHPQVFCALLGKILPSQTQVSGDAANPLHTYDRIEVVVIDPKEQPSPKTGDPDRREPTASWKHAFRGRAWGRWRTSKSI